MKTRASILALATLSAMSVMAFAPAPASAEGAYYGGGYVDVPHYQPYPTYRSYWPARHEACGCETPVREVIREVPVVREVIREVPVVREVVREVPVVREVVREVPVVHEVVREVRVQEPVSEHCHCEAPAPQAYVAPPLQRPVSEPCNCEAPAPQQAYAPAQQIQAPVQQTYAPQDRPGNYAARDLQK